jgi:hypothetical protein
VALQEFDTLFYRQTFLFFIFLSSPIYTTAHHVVERPFSWQLLLPRNMVAAVADHIVLCRSCGAAAPPWSTTW